MAASANGIGFDLESELLARGYAAPCGVDEAGRGPLAGPVVAAAVILDPARIPQGVNDSKKLSAKRRRALFAEIVRVAEVGVAVSSARQIERTDIRRATLDAMRRAVLAMPRRPDFALVDGRDVPPDLGVEARAVVGGDAASLSVAAASIVAKTVRDRIMELACQRWPGYGFSKHAGYGTPDHIAAIRELGPCPIHRMTFAPLKDMSAAEAA